MKPPVIAEIANPYAEPPAPKGISPLKVVTILGSVLLVLGVLFIGAMVALVYGVYYLRKPAWDKPTAARPSEDLDDDLRSQASLRGSPPFGTVNLVTEDPQKREIRLAADVARLEVPVATLQEATTLAEHGDWIDYQRVLNGMRKKTFPIQGTREQLEKLAGEMDARVAPLDNAWAKEDRFTIIKWRVQVGLLDSNGNPTQTSSNKPAPVTASSPVPADLVIRKAAAVKLREALVGRPTDSYVVIGVDRNDKSCTGFTYRMTVGPTHTSGEYIVGSIDGIPVAVERKGEELLRGSQLDYLTIGTAQGFVFDNPNQAKGTLSAPSDTKVASAKTMPRPAPTITTPPPSRPASTITPPPAKTVAAKSPSEEESLTAQARQLLVPVADLTEAKTLASEGGKVGYQRVLLAMKENRLFDTGSREEHDALADKMEENLATFGSAAGNNDKAIIRKWRNRAAQARLKAGALPN